MLTGPVVVGIEIRYQVDFTASEMSHHAGLVGFRADFDSDSEVGSDDVHDVGNDTLMRAVLREERIGRLTRRGHRPDNGMGL